MAKFLTTTGVSYELEELIRGAEERLVLISPFLHVNQRIRELLADKDRLKIDTRVVFGKSELSPEQNEWLSSTPSIRTSFCTNLHAKCYLSEKKALLTSMNLYEFSQVNNREMGVLVDRGDDGPLYDEIYAEAQAILRASEERRPDVSKSTAKAQKHQARADRQAGNIAKREKTRRGQERPSKGKLSSGFCIRCRGELAADPRKPYCPDCYKSWARYKNDAYKEKHCHLCGKNHDATLQHPVCRSCFGQRELAEQGQEAARRQDRRSR